MIMDLAPDLMNDSRNTWLLRQLLQKYRAAHESVGPGKVL